MSIEVKLERIINKFLKRTKSENQIREIDFRSLKEMIKNGKETALIDVRSPGEFSEGRINSAINIPLYDIEKNISKVCLNRNMQIIVYCQSGARSKKACNILKKLGYTNLYNLKGGLDAIPF